MESNNQQQPQNNEDYPVKLDIIYPENSSRLLALLSLLFFFPKVIILIPQLIALYFLGLFSLIAWLVGQLAVLFTGKYPKELFDFVAGYLRWNSRVSAYLFGLTDKYPPFSLK